MAQTPSRPISGHVYRRGDRTPSWYAKYRLPDGRQVNRKIGPVWTGRGRPAEGYFTKRTAEAWLEDLLIEARRGTLPGLVRTGATFETASAEWLRYCEVDRQLRYSTIQHYTQMAARLNETFGERRVEDVTSDEIEAYLVSMKGVANDTRLKYYTAFSGIFKRARRVHKLRYDPMHDVERPRARRAPSFNVLSLEEVHALARAAESEDDAALYVTAAFTGLRQGELLALRWREVDFGRDAIRVERSVTHGREGPPKSGRGRAIPLVPEVAERLARISSRGFSTDAGDLVFPAPQGGFQNPTKVSRRYKTALAAAAIDRPVRFHDLRHTFCSMAIQVMDMRELMEVAGHADLTTTQRYLQFIPRSDAAKRLAGAFTVQAPEALSVP